MDALSSLTRTRAGLAVWAFTLYLTARAAVEHLKIMPDDLPVIFPTAGVVAGLLVINRGAGRWAAILLGSAAAVLATKLVLHLGHGLDVWNVVIPMAMVCIAGSTVALLYRWIAGGSISLGFRGCVALAAPALLCATLGLGFSYLRYQIGTVSLLGRGPDDWRIWLEVWLGNGLGVLLGLPLVVRAAEIRRTRRLAAPLSVVLLYIWAIGAGLVALFVITPGSTVVAIAQISLAVPLLLLASVRFGAGGTILAGLLLAGAAVAGTNALRGPLVAIDADSVDRVIGLQMFLTIIVASAMLLGGAIRDARAMKDELASREERLRAIAEHLPGIIYAYLVRKDGSREPLYASPGLPEVQRALGGYRLGTEMTPFLELIHPEDRAQYLKATERARAEQTGFEAEYRLRVGEGSYRWLRSVARPMKSREGTVWCGFLMDITAQTESARALVESEERLRAVLDNAPNICVQGYDSRGRVVFWNKASERTFGLTEAQAVGRTLDQLVLDRHEAVVFAECIQEIASTGLPAPAREWKYTTQDGRSGWMYSTVFRLPTTGDPLFIRMDVDVTERVRQAEERRTLEDRVREIQRRESIGVLAGGVAHDFNNLLGAILGNADLALSRLAEPTEERRAVETIRQAATRAADLTRQLLDYAGRGRFASQAVDLSEAARETGEILAVSIGRRAKVEFDLDPATPRVRADPTQVRQVVMNLLTNGAEAISGEGGLISVRTGSEELDSASLSTMAGGDEARPGRFGFVEVRDNGRGMDSVEKARVFEPFFTTKFAGRGLGLAAVFGIVQSKGGAIEVESTPGLGSKFTVYFPEDVSPARGTERAGAPKVDAATNGARRPRTALLVEDEPMLRDLVGALLRRAGHEVHAADDGDTALEVVEARGDEIDFVILDLSMPRMPGEVALQRMRERRPGLPVLVTSGNPAEEVAERMRESGPTEFLLKPFRPPELLQALDRLLGNARAPGGRA